MNNSMKYTTKGLSRVLMAVITMAMFLPLSTQAQTEEAMFTITGGTQPFMWYVRTDRNASLNNYDGTPRWPAVRFDPSVQVPVGVDTNWMDYNYANAGNGEAMIDTTGGLEPTLQLTAGTTYMGIAFHVENDPASAYLTSYDDGFNPYCAWYRTGYTGYYYQKWKGKSYFLYITDAGYPAVTMVDASNPPAGVTYWYDWDFGLATRENYTAEGQAAHAYHWLTWDGTKWYMSPNSYNRPETKLYTQTGAGGTYIFDKYFCGDNDAHDGPKGYGAIFMNTKRIVHPKQITDRPVGTGLTGVDLTGDAVADASANLPYGSTLTLTPLFTAGTVQVTRAYDEYREEKQRTGTNLNYRYRSNDDYRSWGRLTEAVHYYYDANADAAAVTDYTTPHNVAPAAEVSTLNLTAERYTYELNNAVKRYVTLTPAVDKNSCVLSYISMPSAAMTATVTVTAHYENGTTDSREVTIHLSAGPKATIGDPSAAPVIAGAVFGGGRMANVNGTTAITMHRCDTVPAVFGGNDISGQVLGEEGSTITLGTAQTAAATPVHIGSVYGGGNGYYDYQYQTDGSTPFVEGVAMDQTLFNGDVRTWSFTNAGDGAVVISGMANAYVPTIKQSHIVVAKNDVLVDSVFGGAKNAYLEGHSGQVVTIDHQAGTVYAEFGGNNYGGTLGAASNLITLNVSGTKTTTRSGVEQSTQTEGAFNSFYGGYGREFGIRYLYGGGNKVAAPTVAINVTGGMVDTLFGGGNSADVAATTVTVNCGTTIFTNPTAVASAPTSWVGGHYNYNVRCLFGGNNRADMAGLPTLTLTKGGVGTVYGGGNAGRMMNTAAAPAAVTALVNGDIVSSSDYFRAPDKLGTFVDITSNDMKIDYVYGGCNKADVARSTYVRMAGGQVGSIFGGCNISGDVGSTSTTDVEGTYGTYVVVKGGQVWENIYGGANGAYHCYDMKTNSATVSDYIYEDGISFTDHAGNAFDPYDDYLGLYIPTHNNSTLVIAGGEVYGDAYGGGNMAHVGYESMTFMKNNAEYTMDGMKSGSVHLSLRGDNSHVHGNVYGGGNMSFVYGLGYLSVSGNVQIDGSLFAGNDKVGMVDAFGKYTVWNGSSELTDLAVTSSNGTEINTTSPGGGYEARYSSYMRIEGTPRIGKVYGGGNGAYNYDGTRPEYGPQLALCDVWKTSFRPEQKSSYIDINTTGRHSSLASEDIKVPSIGTVFGGGNGVGVKEAVTVLINAQYSDAEAVGTVFGGNNRDDMADCVPDVLLTKGMVHDVYGGCNEGNMSKLINFTNTCGELLEGVSSYVQVNSEDITVNGSIFGGCNRADVKGMSYVEILKTSATGIDTVYGGNNISGTVEGNTRIDMIGGTVKTLYGGSNGYYSYYMLEEGVYRTYPYRATISAASDTADKLIAITSGTPVVQQTEVNIFGGTVENNVYGGGRMGDCGNTRVTVDDRSSERACASDNANIMGTIYGGGEGDTAHLAMNKHYGNVSYTSTVDLYHAAALGGGTAKAYGGGKGGDVMNTEITVYDSWEVPFHSIFAGCWGSDVFGTAHLTMDGKEGGVAQNALMVYGGNDLTGNVYRSQLDINSGRYGTIYGAGNGNYDDATYTAMGLTVPNSEAVTVNFNGGIVDSNLYGGGRFGTTFNYRKNDEGRYIDGSGHFVNRARYAAPDTNLSYANAYVDPLNYGYIIVNVHDGTFYQNIYAGARGKDKQLVYGLKMLNMDGGSVEESVYGGSESVDDGYGHGDSKIDIDGKQRYPGSECYYVNARGDRTPTAQQTTMRPSSILNLAGGKIKNNVYGGGYLGNVYGSTYINIGTDAIEHSTVWDTVYTRFSKNTADPEYAIFKPGNDASGLVPALQTKDLWLDASVYGGANWGSNTGSYDFNARGYFGGESRILVDGLSYCTNDDKMSTMARMNIAYSIIGSGTSALGGDVLNRVEVRNYGAMGNNCHATKELRSIQRADTLWLRNTAIRYVGATDAVSAYPSQQYTINRVDHVFARGYNILEIDALMTNISVLNFYEDDGVTLAQRGTLYDNASSCSEIICDKVAAVIDPDTKKYTAMIVNNGVNVDIMGQNGTYGSVAGFAYLMAEQGTNAIVAARSKNDTTHTEDGGFMSSCQSDNQDHTFDGWNTTWVAGTTAPEFEYNNYFEVYRVWSIGAGKRSRYSVILAHAKPSKLSDKDYPLYLTTDEKGNTPSGKMAMAYATLELPASKIGNYYKLAASGIVIKDDNSVMDLADAAWNPKAKVNLDGNTWTTAEDKGRWEKLTDGTVGSDQILANPGTTFGLVMASGNNFQHTGSADAPVYIDPLSGQSGWNNGATVVSGNPNVSISTDFRTASVGGDMANATPILDLFLTYDTNFSTTLLGNVSFILEEYTAEGHQVGTIDVVLTVATIVDSFTNQEYEVLAMYNEGRTNTFIRKAVLPATLEHRDLYLKRVLWVPTDMNGTPETPLSDKFYLTNDHDLVTNMETPNNTFSLSINPADNISSTLTSQIGWHSMKRHNIDLYTLATLATTGASASNDGTVAPPLALGNKAKYIQLNGGGNADSIWLTNVDKDGQKEGMKIGELDGRGLAALNIELTYDGNKIYPEINGLGYIGKAILTLGSYAGTDDRGNFDITIYVKCRKNGDTIYVASADQIVANYPAQGGASAKNFTLNACKHDNDAWNDPKAQQVGKVPSKYVQTLNDAFDKRIYTEGDVIAIIGQVDIENGKQLTIQGSDYANVPIIRYSGHHHEFPGENCVYRGTMINVAGATEADVTLNTKNAKTTSFAARNIDFDGSALGKLKNIKVVDGAWKTDTNYYPDTNQAYGPIIAVKNDHGVKTSVSLENGVTLQHNYNANPTTADVDRRGALSVTDGGRLDLMNNVDIANNINVNNPTPKTSTEAAIPYDGAVYVDNGTITLLESHKETGVTITDNYLMPTSAITYWVPVYRKVKVADVWTDSLARYGFDTLKADGHIVNQTKANVFLTRTAQSGTSAQKTMLDAKSDLITFNNNIPVATRIGITKWFPGPSTRDTIGIAYQPGGNLSYLTDAIVNGIFIPDDPDYDTLYNYYIDNQTIFLHRCATFKHQLVGKEILGYKLEGGEYTYLDNLTSYTNNSETVSGGIKAKDVLHYGYLPDATCPTGGDTIIYRVQGGFFPYTYTWSGDIDKSRTTSTVNNVMMKEIKDGDYTHYLQAIADTIFTQHMEMSRSETQRVRNATVTATDIAGCKLTKKIQVTMNKTSLTVDPFVKETTPDGWKDTNSTVKAVATRNFHGVKITPMVWADRNSGVVYVKDLANRADTFYLEDELSNRHDLTDILFCEGDVIKLATANPYNNGNKFIMWDFDPYYANPVEYVVPAENTDIIAYYGPQTYWTEHINSTSAAHAVYDDNYYYTRPAGANYATAHNGDVHIYNEDGLAWFISVVNGLNGTQARPFYFNNVYLHDKSGGYDMKDYLWTPVGTTQHPFRGRFVGVGSGDTDTAAADADDRVVIKNIIVNEPNVDYAGFFGHIDTATIKSIKIEGALVRGSQYVGALAAEAVNDAYINNVEVTGSSDVPGATGDKNTTILTTHYVSGGMVGLANNVRINNSLSKAKYVGDAVYTGGIVGHGTSATIENSVVTNSDRNIKRMQAVYSGGIAGYLDGTAPVSSSMHQPGINQASTRHHLGMKASTDGRSYVQNNYVHFTSGNAQRVGGLVGYAKNTVIENNYVYGHLEGEATEGGVGAVLDDGTQATHNYYESGAAKQSVGQNRGNAQAGQNISFSGSGNQVTLESSSYGVNNLTRTLNLWVRAHGSDYKTWRSDLEGENHGYPVFGTPDMIPVSEELTVTGCDSVEWDGVTYLFDDEVVSHIVDSVMMVDSTHTLHIVVNHATREQVTDSVEVGSSYSGYGFYLTATEVALLRETMQLHGSSTIVLSDTLQSALTGCDSIVTLQLTVNRQQGIVETPTELQIRVYPNPTTARVTIEATETMSHVELYDNEGRRLQDYNTRQSDNLTIDVSHYPTGAYYLRVHTADNVTIQKLIKK